MSSQSQTISKRRQLVACAVAAVSLAAVSPAAEARPMDLRSPDARDAASAAAGQGSADPRSTGRVGSRGADGAASMAQAMRLRREAVVAARGAAVDGAAPVDLRSPDAVDAAAASAPPTTSSDSGGVDGTVVALAVAAVMGLGIAGVMAFTDVGRTRRRVVRS